MAKTSVEVDPDILREAQLILGTTTLRSTINAALREIVLARRRLDLVTLLADSDRFAFDLVDGSTQTAWGGDHGETGNVT